MGQDSMSRDTKSRTAGYDYRVRYWGRCAIRCGLIDSVLVSHAGAPRINHLCILHPGHTGECDFIRPCKRSLE